MGLKHYCTRIYSYFAFPNLTEEGYRGSHMNVLQTAQRWTARTIHLDTDCPRLSLSGFSSG
jgi:hypothetical protein